MKAAAIAVFALVVIGLVVVGDIATETERARIRNTRHVIEELREKDTPQ